LGELEHRLTPREMIRDGVDSLSHYEAGRYVLQLGALLRHYPVPAALAGASVVGLIFAGRQRFKSRYSYSKRSTARLSQALDSARGKLHDTRRSLSPSVDTTREKLADATSSIRERARECAGNAGRQLRRAGAGVQSIARQRPIAMSAIALAVGAAVGLGIPALRRRLY
ncbi:MAG: hypothetical protein ABI619_06130, partial [Betaproteobacteria bacterium]